MEIGETIYPVSRDEWRSWLEKNNVRKNTVWLMYYKKGSGKPSIPYEDAVEEAICFGWIDSTAKSVDDERYVQMFARRDKKSRWSETNIRRAEKMIGQGKMAEAGLRAFSERREYERMEMEYSDDNSPVIPADLLAALGDAHSALQNFKSFSPSYKRLSILWINDAKRAATRKKRIDEIAGLAAENKKKQWI
jgi:uncharacterized protein YdeI (YjbR/CyaY-like superfamily)